MMKKREANFELLRIICMLMIIVLHIAREQPSIQNPMGGIDYVVGNLFRSFAIVAVDCFILISGYWGINFRFNKVLKLQMQVWEYSVLLFGISVATGIHIFNLKKDIKFLFPCFTKQWWFITIYLVLYILSPWLNEFVEILQEKQLKKLLRILFVLFCICPTFSYLVAAPTITNDAGYGIINFIFIYMLGRYIRLYYQDKYDKKIYLIGYILFCFALFGMNFMLTRILGFYYDALICYDSIFCFVASVFLFLYFKNVKITSKFINYLSKNAFAVYLIHMHPAITKYIFENILRVHKYSGWKYIAFLLLAPIMIYLICWGGEMIRLLLFGRLEDTIIQYIGCWKFSKQENN